MFNQREVFQGAEIRALVHTMCYDESGGRHFRLTEALFPLRPPVVPPQRTSIGPLKIVWRIKDRSIADVWNTFKTPGQVFPIINNIGVNV